TRETFWALDDVSFEVKHGEALGIIGRNGAGKSTLLKILSRITKPTRGTATVYGRVGSLLEVGTGFHPELTGRENIYLNGAILGMTKRDIERHFDEIVAFAEVEQFLDTPVKRYSSGMYMRLAFAVAAHLEPEVLVVDEVLAVGDAAFQKKCLGKMSEVAKGGRTVLFVSHNMSAVKSLCANAVLLSRGRLMDYGPSDAVVQRYLEEGIDLGGDILRHAPRQGNGRLRLTGFHLEDPSGRDQADAETGQPIAFVLDYSAQGLAPTDRVSFGFSVETLLSAPLFFYYSHFSGVWYQGLDGLGSVRCVLPDLPLSAGKYLVGFRVVMNGDQTTGEVLDYPLARVGLDVSTVDFYGTDSAFVPDWGPMAVRGEWQPAEPAESEGSPA
ncbi:MAG: ABC transporter ATP-binding protein, partial [Caldilineaceae bacterium]